MTYLLAYLAGTLTLVNPCVLPLLPVVLAAALQQGRSGPLWLAAGLVTSFTLVGVGVTAFGHLAGIDERTVNRAAAVMMVAFGVVLLVPRAQAAIATLASPLANRANAGINRAGPGGSAGQFLAGILLGAVWSPCIGPTLGGAIGLAASGQDLGQATAIMLTFGLGLVSVLLGLAYGSRTVLATRRARLTAWMPWAKPVMGATLVLVGVMVFFHLNLVIDRWLLDVMPVWLQDFSVSNSSRVPRRSKPARRMSVPQAAVRRTGTS